MLLQKKKIFLAVAKSLTTVKNNKTNDFLLDFGYVETVSSVLL